MGGGSRGRKKVFNPAAAAAKQAAAVDSAVAAEAPPVSGPSTTLRAVNGAAPFARLVSCCSLCGAEPEEGAAFKACGACGVTRYCSPECQRTAWKKPVGHKASCGAKQPLPSPDALAAAAAPAVCAVLREFGRADVELTHCCLKRAAELCASDAAQRVVLLEAGLAVAACGAMQAHLLTRRVQLAGCAALSAVATAPAAGARTAVAETAGGVSAVVAAMQAHDDVAEVQERCCAALGTLVVGMAVAAAEPALCATIGAMRTHAEADGVQRCGCTVLCNIAGGTADGPGAVLRHGGAAAAVAAMRSHLTLAVQTQGCGALGNMAGGDAAAQRDVLDAGGAAALVSALRAFPDEAGLQRAGRSALANAAWGDATMRAECVAAGADTSWLGDEEVHEGNAA